MGLGQPQIVAHKKTPVEDTFNLVRLEAEQTSSLISGLWIFGESLQMVQMGGEKKLKIMGADETATMSFKVWTLTKCSNIKTISAGE